MRALAKDPDDRFQTRRGDARPRPVRAADAAEQGGHTGTWDTGFVDHTAATSVLPGAAATTVMSGHSHTAELGPPLIMGPPVGPAEPAYGHMDAVPSAHRGRNAVLLLVAAVLAIGLGVFFALKAADQNGGQRNPSNTTSPSVTDTTGPVSNPTQRDSGGDDQSTITPSQPRTEPSDTQPSTSGSPSATPSAPSSGTPSAPPSTPPTTPPASGGTDTGGDTGGGTGGGANTGGDTGGGTGGGTSTGGGSGSGGTGSGRRCPGTDRRHRLQRQQRIAAPTPAAATDSGRNGQRSPGEGGPPGAGTAGGLYSAGDATHAASVPPAARRARRSPR